MVSSHRILHLSDTHATATGIDEDGVDALAALDQILRDCRHLTGLDLVVVSGDIADDGSAQGPAAGSRTSTPPGTMTGGPASPPRSVPGTVTPRTARPVSFSTAWTTSARRSAWSTACG